MNPRFSRTILQFSKTSQTEATTKDSLLKKKSILKNFAKFVGKHLCQSLFFNKVAGLKLKKKTLEQVFSCEFFEIF